MLPAWRAFADEIRGELAVGCMAIRGATVDGARLDVETVFGDGAQPERTLVRLVLDPPLPKPMDPASREALTRLPPGTRDLVTELLASGKAMRIEPYQMEVEVAGPLEDPSTLRQRMATMITLARRLRGAGAAGPYR